MNIDEVRLAFDANSLHVLNVILGLVMFGVALDLRLEDFQRLLARPKAPLVGLLCQFILLPPLAWLLSRVIAPGPSIALGMVLVSACPGGNMSNFMTHLSGGRTETSVGMTAVSTAAAVVMTPLNIALWGGMSADTAALVQSVALDPWEMFRMVLVLLGVPIFVGMATARWLPRLAAALRRPFKVGSVLFFAVFVLIAFGANFAHFLAWIAVVFLPVLAMNAMAFALGYGAGAVSGLDEGDRRAVTIEVGIQNSGLGLVLVFNFFDGMGGMAIVAAWWGIWHILAGLTLSWFWSRNPAIARAPTAASAT